MDSTLTQILNQLYGSYKAVEQLKQQNQELQQRCMNLEMELAELREGVKGPKAGAPSPDDVTESHPME